MLQEFILDSLQHALPLWASEAGLSLPLALWVTSEGAEQYQLPQTWEEGAAEARPTPSPDLLWEF